MTEPRVFVDDFPSVTLDDIRRQLGSRRRFREASAVTVHLNDRDVYVPLVRGPANLGGGEIVFAMCPSCERKVRVLRVIPDSPGLGCVRCLATRYGAKYLSQMHSATPSSPT